MPAAVAALSQAGKRPHSCAGAFLRGDICRAGRQRRGAVRGSLGALAERKAPPQRGGVFAWRHSPGRTAKKGRCPRQSGRSRGQKRCPRSARGVFAWRHSPDRTAKRAVRGVRCVLTGGKSVSVAVRGRFCVTTFAGQNGKARCLQRSGALAGGKTSPQQPHRSLRRKNVPTAAAPLSLAEKTSPQQSYRSLRQKKHPTARGNAFSACPALMGGANTARRARSHLWRGARAAASAAISPPAPTRGAGRFSVSRASMHRPPKTQMASRR